MAESISPEYVRELLEQIRRLEKQVADLQGQVANRDRRIADLEGQPEAARRAAKRQAAPFSKGEPKEDPKRLAASRARNTVGKPCVRFQPRSTRASAPPVREHAHVEAVSSRAGSSVTRQLRSHPTHVKRWEDARWVFSREQTRVIT